jgi:hypothetical protein
LAQSFHQHVFGLDQTQMDLDIHDFEIVDFENLNGLVHFLW